MAGLCKAVLIGNLGRDPEMRYLPSGKPVTSFSVACNRVYTTAEGEKREETEWFRVSAFGRQGEICSQYLKKGSQVYVEGRIQTRSWVGQDGQKQFGIDVVATDVRLLGSRPRGEPGDMGTEEHGGAGTGEDQIPF